MHVDPVKKEVGRWITSERTRRQLPNCSSSIFDGCPVGGISRLKIHDRFHKAPTVFRDRKSHMMMSSLIASCTVFLVFTSGNGWCHWVSTVNISLAKRNSLAHDLIFPESLFFAGYQP